MSKADIFCIYLIKLILIFAIYLIKLVIIFAKILVKYGKIVYNRLKR